jgi:NAD(P)H-dependent flavin oxidoreductase YrpB (nitropropane dioxygenase family)
MFNTRITGLLGIQYPIIQGAMLELSKAELVAAVSNGGALGILSSPTFPTKQEFREEVRKTKVLTSKPFAVNVVFLPVAREVPNEEYVEVILEEKVPVVETVGSLQASLIKRLHKDGVICIHKATSVEHALSAERKGVDAVTVEGYECAGHPGMDRISSLVLIQRTVQELSIPVIAGGGFVDGRGLVAALALGAEGVLMGTRFFMTKECTAHQNIKEWCLNAKETDTVFGLMSLGFPARYMRTDLSERVLGMEARGARLPELLTVISGQRYKKLLDSGNFEDGVCTAGQCVGLIHDILSIGELIVRIMVEAEEVRERLSVLK